MRSAAAKSFSMLLSSCYTLIRLSLKFGFAFLSLPASRSVRRAQFHTFVALKISLQRSKLAHSQVILQRSSARCDVWGAKSSTC